MGRTAAGTDRSATRMRSRRPPYRQPRLQVAQRGSRRDTTTATRWTRTKPWQPRSPTGRGTRIHPPPNRFERTPEKHHPVSRKEERRPEHRWTWAPLVADMRCRSDQLRHDRAVGVEHARQECEIFMTELVREVEVSVHDGRAKPRVVPVAVPTQVRQCDQRGREQRERKDPRRPRHVRDARTMPGTVSIRRPAFPALARDIRISASPAADGRCEPRRRSEPQPRQNRHVDDRQTSACGSGGTALSASTRAVSKRAPPWYSYETPVSNRRAAPIFHAADASRDVTHEAIATPFSSSHRQWPAAASVGPSRQRSPLEGAVLSH